MLNFTQLFLRDRRQIAVLVSLVFATLVCALLLFLRATYAHSPGYFGLLWNLFLAWLPMLASLAAYNFYQQRARAGWLIIPLCLLLWLLFFPNAPYILTDLIHLRPWENVPLWFDLILIVSFAWCGTFLGLVSLYLMQMLVHQVTRNRAVSWLFALVVLGLGGFGVYLGRFPRWNSWDVLLNPIRLLLDIWDRLRHPIAHAQTFAFSALFALLLMTVYLMLVALIQLRPDLRRN